MRKGTGRGKLGRINYTSKIMRPWTSEMSKKELHEVQGIESGRR